MSSFKDQPEPPVGSVLLERRRYDTYGEARFFHYAWVREDHGWEDLGDSYGSMTWEDVAHVEKDMVGRVEFRLVLPDEWVKP